MLLLLGYVVLGLILVLFSNTRLRFGFWLVLECLFQSLGLAHSILFFRESSRYRDWRLLGSAFDSGIAGLYAGLESGPRV